jgi:hypothetical protein
MCAHRDKSTLLLAIPYHTYIHTNGNVARISAFLCRFLPPLFLLFPRLCQTRAFLCDGLMNGRTTKYETRYLCDYRCGCVTVTLRKKRPITATNFTLYADLITTRNGDLQLLRTSCDLVAGSDDPAAATAAAPSISRFSNIFSGQAE